MNIYTKKRHTSPTKSTNRQNYIYKLLCACSITLLFLTCLLISYAHTKRNKIPQNSIPTSNIKTLSTSSDIAILHTGLGTDHFNYDYNFLTKCLKNMFFKANNYEESDHDMSLEIKLFIFLQNVSPVISETIQIFVKETKQIHNIIENKHKSSIKLNTYTYTFTEIFLKYLKVSSTTFELFKGKNRKNLEALMNTNDENMFIVKLTFQHLLLKRQLITILHIAYEFKDLLKETSTKKKFNFAIHKIYSVLCDMISLIYIKMFKEKEIEENVTLKEFNIQTILTSVYYYQRLLIVNYCFMYLNLFEIDSVFLVEKIDITALPGLEKLDGYKKIKNKEWKDELVKDCRYFFRDLSNLTIGKLDEFYMEFGDKNKVCLDNVDNFVSDLIRELKY
eukprot:GAHX01002335.1.p1 GENE.GAHX01002335.1~~GAHX01002335.1.p1  ORF type:complete len:391 (+),score=61.18 GAHX01002335.1:166-1338(+)